MIRALGGAGLAIVMAISVPAVEASPTHPSAGMATCTDASTGRSTTAVVKRIRVGNGPQGVAVDSAADVVYVTNANSDSMSIIDGDTAAVIDTIDGFAEPSGVAINEADDIVYVANADDSSVVAITEGGLGSRSTTQIAGSAWDVAVDQDDDTVYATVAPGPGTSGALAVLDRQGLSSVVPLAGMTPIAIAVNSLTDRVYVTGQNTVGAAVLDGARLVVEDTLPLVGSYWGVAVHEADDTAYFANYEEQGSFAIVSGRTSQIVSNRPMAFPWGVAVSQRAHLVYVSRGPANAVTIIDATTGRPTGPDIAIRGFPIALAIDQAGDDAGAVYVAQSDSASVSVLASVRPMLRSATVRAGARMVIAVDVQQLVGYDLASRAVSAVCFAPVGALDGVSGGRVTPLKGDRWGVQVPARLSGGTYRVGVTFDGGLQARAGTVTVRQPG